MRSQTRDEACQYSFQGRTVLSDFDILPISSVWVMNAIYFICAGQSREKAVEDHTGYDSHLVAALGIHWAHAVTIRLVLDSKSGLPNICFS